MANTITTPLMNLELPIVGVQVGPDWASNINEALSLVDSHNHTSGAGALIPVAGMNINSNLPLNGNNVVTARSVRFNSQASILANADDKSSVSVVNGNLVFNNSSGVAVQITSGGGLNFASLGTIGGDYGQSGVTASVSYSNTTKTYSFTQSPGITGKMLCADISLTEPIAGGNSVLLKTPASLVAGYTITMPTSLAAAQSFVTLSPSGQLANYASIIGGILGSNIASSTITVTNMADNSISTSKIQDASITAAKMTPSAYSILKAETFTASGNWTCPVGVTEILIAGCGGGGGGGSGGFGTAGWVGGGGGGGGSITMIETLTVAPSTVYPITIGSGGLGSGPAAPAQPGGPGNPGGTTSFSTLAQWRGGLGGNPGTTTGGAATASSFSSGVHLTAGGFGGQTALSGDVGERSVKFAGGSNTGQQSSGGGGGASSFGKGGDGSNGGINAQNGQGYGSGGGGSGGTNGSGSGGNGANGIIVIIYSAPA